MAANFYGTRIAYLGNRIGLVRKVLESVAWIPGVNAWAWAKGTSDILILIIHWLLWLDNQIWTPFAMVWCQECNRSLSRLHYRIEPIELVVHVTQPTHHL